MSALLHSFSGNTILYCIFCEHLAGIIYYHIVQDKKAFNPNSMNEKKKKKIVRRDFFLFLFFTFVILISGKGIKYNQRAECIRQKIRPR